MCGRHNRQCKITIKIIVKRVQRRVSVENERQKIIYCIDLVRAKVVEEPEEMFIGLQITRIETLRNLEVMWFVQDEIHLILQTQRSYY